MSECDYSVRIGDLGTFDSVTLVNRMNAEEAKLPRRLRRHWTLRWWMIGDLVALLSQTQTQPSAVERIINSVIAQVNARS